jgi:hypothetical protein
MVLEELVRQAIQAAGIKGVSVGAVVLIVAAYAYTSKAATAGGAVVSTASRTGSHLRAALVLGLALLLLGVISVDTTQATQVAGRAWRMISSGAWSVW